MTSKFPILCASVLSGFAFWFSVSPRTHAALLLDDSLQGTTSGTMSGGALVSGGWKVITKDDCIFWHVATITNGAAEFDVRGLNPNECRTGMNDKTELFHMYDYSWNNADYNYAPGYRDD